MACGRLRHHSYLKSILLVLVFFCVGFFLVARQIYRVGDVFLPLYAYELNSTADANFVSVAAAELEKFNVTWQHPLCGCWRSLVRVGSSSQMMTSSCGPVADARGLAQKVISYSFYGDTNSGYFRGVAVNSEAIENLYDGWVMRLYHDISPKDSKGMADLCGVVCNYSILDDCYVGDRKIDHVNLLSKFGMLWRFAVMGDSTVELFAVRDLDSPVYQREVDAVDDWIASNTTWHIMRDNPVHFANILGGMWGGNNRHKLTEMQQLRAKIFASPDYKYKSYDQQLLAKIVWPHAILNMTAHDSFLCGMYPNTKPWPTRRVNRTFVGDMYGVSIARECPLRCRPSDHIDWTYC